MITPENSHPKKTGKRLPVVDGSFNFWDSLTDIERQEWISRDMAEAEMYNLNHDLTKEWTKYAGLVMSLSGKSELSADVLQTGKELQAMKRDGLLIVLGEDEIQTVGRLLEGIDMWEANDAKGAYIAAMAVEKLGSRIEQNLEASLNRAHLSATKVNGLSVQSVDENAGRYTGKIVSSSELHWIQDIGMRTAVIHYKGKMDRMVMVGQNLTVQYSDGIAGIVERFPSIKRER
jgi:hypothetical protein